MRRYKIIPFWRRAPSALCIGPVVRWIKRTPCREIDIGLCLLIGEAGVRIEVYKKPDLADQMLKALKEV